jgi:ABC-type uncharacterized transport system substrate-binding protein
MSSSINEIKCISDLTNVNDLDELQKHLELNAPDLKALYAIGENNFTELCESIFKKFGKEGVEVLQWFMYDLHHRKKK